MLCHTRATYYVQGLTDHPRLGCLQSAAPALKATLGKQPEAWPDVREALLSVARGAVQQLVDQCQQQAGDLKHDLTEVRHHQDTTSALDKDNIAPRLELRLT